MNKRRTPSSKKSNRLSKLSDSQSQFASKWLPNIAVVSLLVSLAYVVLLYGSAVVLFKSYISSNGCTSGVAIGCSSGSSLLLELGTIIILTVVAMLLVRWLIVKSWLVSLMIAAPAAILVNATNTSSLITPSTTESGGLKILPYTLTLIVIITVALLINVFIVRLLGRKHIVLPVVVLIALSVAYYFLVPSAAYSQQVYQAQSQQKDYAQNLGFAVYEPTFIPAVYKLWQGPSIIDVGGGALDYTFSYIAGDESSLTNHSSFAITQFAAPSRYQPPADCGGVQPNFSNGAHVKVGCSLFGHSQVGCDVYIVYEKDYINAYCKLGETLITYDTRFLVDKYRVQPADIVKIFDSLKPTTPRQ